MEPSRHDQSWVMLRPGFALLRVWRFAPLVRCRVAQVRAPVLRLDEHAGDFRIGGLDLGLDFTYPGYSNPGVVLSEADVLEMALEELRRVAMAVDGHLEDREILGSEPTRALAGAG